MEHHTGEEKIKLLKIYDNESGREIFPIGYEPLEPNISVMSELITLFTNINSHFEGKGEYCFSKPQRMHRKKRINKKLQKKYGEKVCFDFLMR